MSEKAPFMTFSEANSRYLAEKICASLGCPLRKMNITHFADDEFVVSYEESVRGANVLPVQSALPNPDNLTELLLMVNAAKGTSAKSVIIAIPYPGRAHQDREDKPRVSIGAKLMADLLSVAGIDRLTTMDLRADQIRDSFNIPVDHLYALVVFLPHIESSKLDDLVIATPGASGSKCVSTFPKCLGASSVLRNKTYEKVSVVTTIQIIGDVQDRNIVSADDIIDTAGTATEAANIMMEAGVKSVCAITSHCVMSNPASFRVQEPGLTGMVFTNSIPCAKKCVKVKQLSIVDMFIETIRRVMTNESISF